MSPITPIISIIVPIYNRSQWLSMCLDSILEQTFTNWECILVNDGSTDSSLAIIQSYAHNDSRFRVYSQENQGVSAARNLGLDHAQGKWLTFVDSDDEIAPDYLEILHKIGEENDADLVNGSRILYDKRDNKSSLILDDTVYDYQDENFGNRFAYRMSGVIKLFRHTIIKEHKIRFESKFQFAEDLIFTLDFFLRAQRIATSSKAIYKYINRKEDNNQLHKKFYNIEREKELYDKIVSYYELIRKRYPFSNELLIFKGVFVYGFIQRLLYSIESSTSSLTQRYKMYRSITPPSKIQEKGSIIQSIRDYLLNKRMYFLFALSRIWLNRN